ncbi:hypothetical protein ACFT5C_03820 [Streptomyces sp. NPDC057116]|uniref:hypothetical protein n=1 Tax=Streptomyces sp. NPDC057116 TaxID=3346023 RepID=UPI003643EC61
METGDLAAVAVGVLAAVVTGTATGVGEQAGAAVVQIVRDRLGASDRGRTALAELEATGASSESQAAASAVLTEEIEADPRLRQALTVHLDEPHAPGGVVIHRSRLRDNPILVGDGTLVFKKPTSPAGMLGLVLAILVVLAVIVLAVYGGGRLLGTDGLQGDGRGGTSAPAAEGGGPAPVSGGGKTEGSSRPRALTQAETREVVPALEDLPPGWQVTSGRAVGDVGSGCYRATANYQNPDVNAGNLMLLYRVTACRDARTVSDGYAKVLKNAQAGDGERETRIAMPPCGDESVATTRTITDDLTGGNGDHIKTRARVGTLYIEMNYGPVGDGFDRIDYLERVQQLAAQLCSRALAAQSGR